MAPFATRLRPRAIITEFADAVIDQRIEHQADLAQFELAGHSVELYGICSACR